jgi:hypothetical protein
VLALMVNINPLSVSLCAAECAKPGAERTQDAGDTLHCHPASQPAASLSGPHDCGGHPRAILGERTPASQLLTDRTAHVNAAAASPDVGVATLRPAGEHLLAHSRSAPPGLLPLLI